MTGTLRERLVPAQARTWSELLPEDPEPALVDFHNDLDAGRLQLWITDEGSIVARCADGTLRTTLFHRGELPQLPLRKARPPGDTA